MTITDSLIDIMNRMAVLATTHKSFSKLYEKDYETTLKVASLANISRDIADLAKTIEELAHIVQHHRIKEN